MENRCELSYGVDDMSADPLPAKIEDPDLGVGDTTVEPEIQNYRIRNYDSHKRLGRYK